MNHQSEHGDCIRSEYDFERLNYHYGQMMLERDFRDQQRYYNEKRWMMNRFGIGWGVVHGLKVRIIPDSCNSKDNASVPPDIEIEPGFALDQYGNEILVTSIHSVNTAACLDEHHECGKAGQTSYEPGIIHPVYIAVRYRECGIEPFRIPDVNCCDPENDCAYSRTRESQEFIVYRKPCNHDHDHHHHNHQDDNSCKTDYFNNLSNQSDDALEDHPERVQCRPVPLARLHFKKGQWIIDNKGIRPIAYSNYRLGELVNCLTMELGKTYAAGYDRRSFVPLLAQTIPGLKWRSGRTKLFENIGEVPFRITTDGRYVWCTDAALSVVHHLPVATGTRHTSPVSIDLSAQQPGWGIAFAGDTMWVTIPGKNAVEKINVYTLEKQMIPLGQQSINPREIVFDGQYLWISSGPVFDEIDKKQSDSSGNHHEEHHHHNNHHTDTDAGKRQKPEMHREKVDHIRIMRLDPFDNEITTIEIPGDQKEWVSPPIGMAFDGRSLWIAYNDHEYRAVVQKINIWRNSSEQTINKNTSIIDEPIYLRGNGAKDIAFDGNAIWVTHDEGASKIDLLEYAEIGVSNDRGRLSSMVFDGQGMWMVQNRENESEIKRCNLLSLQFEGGYELRKGEYGFHIGHMCFDGSYLWVTGNKTDLKSGKGIIYRIIP